MIGSLGQVFAHGDLHVFIEKLDREIKVQPKNAELYLQRAALHLEHHDTALCLRDLIKAKNLATENPKALLLEAKARLAQRQWTQSRQLLTQYLAKSPQSGEAFYLRSQVLTALNQPDAALADALAAIDALPSPPLEYDLHAIHLAQNAKRQDSISALFTKALQRHGELPALLDAQAAWLTQAGQRQEACTIYQKIRQKYPNLALRTRIAEFVVWNGHDQAKAQAAHEAVRSTWQSLPQKWKQRPALVSIYQNFLNTPLSPQP